MLVVPSTWEENAPLVLGEARAAGLRIVATELGGMRELAPEARFVAPGSVEALRNALAAEARAGVGRVSPASPPSMREHAAAMLAHYDQLRKSRPTATPTVS